MASSSFASDIVDTVKEAFKSDTPDPCDAIMSSEYKRMVDKVATENQLNAKVHEKMANLANVVAKLGQTKEEKEKLARNLNNPRELCKATIEISERQVQTYKDHKESANKITTFIDKALKEGWNYAELKDEAEGFFSGSYSTKFLMEVLEPPKNNNLPAFQDQLVNIQKIFKQTEDQAASNIEQTPEAKPDCGYLPDDKEANLVGECKRVGFATKALAVWRLIKEASGELKRCVAKLITETIITKLVEKAVDQVITILTDVFGLFAFRIIKIVYYAAKLVYYIYKAVKTAAEVDEKSKYWGKAAGTVFKIVLTAVTGRRKIKKLK